MPKRQKGKHHKRARAWHHGRSVGTREARNPLPDVGSGADPTAGVPRPAEYGPGKRIRSQDRLS